MSSFPVPPQIQVALDQLKQAIQSVDRKEIDPRKTPWPELEQSVIKLLGGPFNMEEPQHQGIAAGLAGILGERMNQEFQAFWFPQRDSPEGAAMGFPEELIMLSPFGAVVDALSSANLVKLDGLIAEIRRTLGQARFGAGAGGRPRLTPEAYQQLFDPGFVQFVVLDPDKAKAAWDGTPAALAREIKDALGRATQLPQEARQQMEGQLVGSLQRLDPARPLMEQAERTPRVAEMLTHLFGTVDGTGFAPEEFWQQVAMPLLFIGAPSQFPPLEQEELEAFGQGADPLALFVDLVPYQIPSEEEGLLGVFPVSEIGLVHPGFSKAGTLRLMHLKADTLRPLMERFDPATSKQALERFVAYLEEKSGKKVQPAGQGPSMADAAFALLTDLKRVIQVAGQGKNGLGLRRVTEAEAASEGALLALRNALRAPRIILA
jgi:hypothetical protein